MTGLWFDRDGKEITSAEHDLLQDQGEKYRRVADHMVTRPNGERFHISTIWTGMNVGVGPIRRKDEPEIELPIEIFESKIFCDDEDHPMHLSEKRYSTLEEAQAGHQKGVDILMKSFKGATLVDRVAAGTNGTEGPAC